MGFTTMIGIDLGKFKSVACVIDVATRQHRFCTFDTTPAALHEVLLSAQAPADTVEACTLLAIETCDASGSRA